MNNLRFLFVLLILILSIASCISVNNEMDPEEAKKAMEERGLEVIDKDILYNIIDSSDKPYQYVLIFRGLCGGNESMKMCLDSIPNEYRDSINYIFCNCDTYGQCDDMDELVENSQLKNHKIYMIDNEKYKAENEFLRTALFARDICNVWKAASEDGEGIPYPIVLDKMKKTISFKKYISTDFDKVLEASDKGKVTFWDYENEKFSTIESDE